MRAADRTFGTLHEELRAQARRRPEATALVYRDRRLSYRELETTANRLAHHLRKNGVGPEVKVALCLERCPELVLAMVAVLKAGGTHVPIDPLLPRARMDTMVRDSGALLTLDREWLERHRADIDRESDEPPRAGVNRENIAYLTYTSGSTGKPKAAEIPHRAIFGVMDDVDYVDIDETQVFLQHSSPSWDACTFELWSPLLHGGTAVLFPEARITPRGLGQAIREHGVTITFLTSSLFNIIVDTDPEALRPLQQLVVGGEPLSRRHVARALRVLPGLRLVNGYGPSECTVFACTARLEAPFAELGGPVAVGHAVGDRQVLVLDARSNLVPIGVPGELCIGGDSLARGYLGQPRLTARAFVPHPFSSVPGARLYRTGDLARYLPDRSIEILRRIDRQVKIRGYRIELEEIEAVVGQCTGVRRAVATVHTDASDTKRIVAYVVPVPGETLDVDELRRDLEREMPRYAVPSAFVVLEELPLTGTGKIDRARLPAPRYGQAPDTATPATPHTGLPRRIADIWSEVLDLPHVGLRDSFFEVGGNSLLILRVHAKMEAMLQREVSVVDLFQYPTIEDLARHLEEAPTTSEGRCPRADAHSNARVPADRDTPARPGADPGAEDGVRDRAARQRAALRGQAQRVQRRRTRTT